MAYPVNISVEPALRNRNRLTTFFRIILAIPHLILVGGAAFGLGSGMGGGTLAHATRDNLCAAPRDQVESSELLKNANGVGGAENRNCASETDIFRARGGSGEDYNGS